MVYEQQLRTWLENFQMGRLSVTELLERVTTASYNMHLDSSAAAQEMAAAIQLSIWEFQNDDFNEATLRRRLAMLTVDQEDVIAVTEMESMLFDSAIERVVRSVFEDDFTVITIPIPAALASDDIRVSPLTAQVTYSASQRIQLSAVHG